MIPCETVPTNENKCRKPKPNAWAVCNEAGQAFFGNFRPWNLQRVLVLTVTSAEGEGVHPFFGAKSFLRSIVHRTEPSDSCDFFHGICSCLLVSFIVICFIHNYPNNEQHAHSCLVGFKSLFYGSTFPAEEQVWKWGGASCHAARVTNHPCPGAIESKSCNFPTSSPLLSFYRTTRTCLYSDLWLLWHAQHVNSRTRVYAGSTR